MNRFLFSVKITFLLFLFYSFSSVYGNPIDQQRAQKVGLNFLKSNTDLSISKDASNCRLAYQKTTETSQGETVICFYIFNISDEGFVIVTADDAVKPILGYSTESSFDENDIPENMAVYLNSYTHSIVYAIENHVVHQKTLQEWKNIENNRFSSKSNRSVDPLLDSLTWHQNCYYNSLCPEDPDGSCGHVYAGCVATAMAQIIKFWESPATGTGSHSYVPSGYPQQNVNYGITNYNYSIMPDKLDSTSSEEEIFAVAQLQWHCGVAVDMMYGDNGSGAYSNDVPEALISHFNFNDNMDYSMRDNFSLVQWQNKLKASFDTGIPVYYSAQDEGGAGGHAFVCDGYDENDLFHFNWGWNGRDNGFYAIDALNPGSTNYQFNSWQCGIFNIIPNDVINAMAQAPTNFTITPAPNYGFSALLSWTNPTQTLNNSPITSIESIKILRNNSLILSIENPEIGANLSWTDNTIPDFGSYTYTIYAVTEAGNGATASQVVGIGPFCPISIEMHDTFGDGWNGASIDFFDNTGNIAASVTIQSGSLLTESLTLPQGMIDCVWNDGSWDEECSFTIFDGEGTQLYVCSNAQSINGTFFSFDNQCENPPVECVPPTNFTVLQDYSNYNDPSISLTWDVVPFVETYNIYCFLENEYILIASTNSEGNYEISNESQEIIQIEYNSTYCFAITSECEDGESAYSEIECVDIETPMCNPPSGLTATPEGSTILLSWTASESEGTYEIFRDNQLLASTTDLTFSDSDVEVSQEYCYTVRMDCEINYSEFSNESCSMIEACDMPNNFSISDNGNFDNLIFTLQWDAVDDATSYNIFRDNELIGTSEVNTFEDFNVQPNVEYSYFLSTVCPQGTSETTETILHSFIPENIQELDNKFAIYPNPANDQVIIGGEKFQKVIIYNIAGQLIAETEQTVINTNVYVNGVYLFRIVTSSGDIVSKRVIIQH